MIDKISKLKESWIELITMSPMFFAMLTVIILGIKQEDLFYEYYKISPLFVFGLLVGSLFVSLRFKQIVFLTKVFNVLYDQTVIDMNSKDISDQLTELKEYKNRQIFIDKTNKLEQKYLEFNSF